MDAKKINDFYKMDHELVTEIILEPPNGIEDSFCRGDFIDTHDGLKCLEVNMGPNIGGWQIRFWAELYLQTPHVKRFLEQEGVRPKGLDPIQTMLRHVIRVAVRNGSAKSGELNIAIVFDAVRPFKGIARYLDETYKTLLEKLDTGLEGRMVHCYYPDGLTQRGRNLYVGDDRVDVVIESTGVDTPEAVFRTSKLGSITLFDGPVTYILKDKRNLALLSQHEDSDLFTAEERSIIADHIPWSRNLIVGDVSYHGLTVRMPEFLIAHREKFVIKAAQGLQGREVIIGKFTDEDAWARNVRAMATSGDWIAQEFLESRAYYYQRGHQAYQPHDLVWGTFSFGREFGGGFLRLNPKDDTDGIINSHHGASESMFFEV